MAEYSKVEYVLSKLVTLYVNTLIEKLFFVELDHDWIKSNHIFFESLFSFVEKKITLEIIKKGKL